MPRRRSKPEVVPSPTEQQKHCSHPFDERYGTDTGGLIPREKLVTGSIADKHVTAYYGVAPSILRSLIDRWHEETNPVRDIEQYTFLDIGAGKGRAVIIAAENPFKEVIGVELNPQLAAMARDNVSLVTGREADRHSVTQVLLAPIQIVEGDALLYPLSPYPMLVLLFHPFEAAALRIFLRRVEAVFATQPDILDLLYINAEHLALFRRNPRFAVLWEGDVPMSTEDHLADLREIATQLEYGSTGDEHCAIIRYIGAATR